MNTSLKVKNGIIVLPKRIRTQWKDTEVKIREDTEGRIILERTMPRQEEEIKETIELLRQTAGILKGRIHDPVAWQRKIREEWDRKLPKLHVHR